MDILKNYLLMKNILKRINAAHKTFSVEFINQDCLNQPIENYSKRFMVRVKFFLHIDPLTEAKNLKPFLTSVREIISKHKQIDKQKTINLFTKL